MIENAFVLYGRSNVNFTIYPLVYQSIVVYKSKLVLVLEFYLVMDVDMKGPNMPLFVKTACRIQAGCHSRSCSETIFSFMETFALMVSVLVSSRMNAESRNG